MMTIQEQIEYIKISDYIQEYILETEEELKKFLDTLFSHGTKAANLFLLDRGLREISNSSHLENARYSDHLLAFYENKFSKEKNLSEDLIKQLHTSIIDEQHKDIVKPGTYRTTPGWVGPKDCSLEKARFVALKEELIESYMNDFVSFYNEKGEKDAYQPFIQSALIHVYFTMIHPFNDGNGRVARILQTQKITDWVKEQYGYDILYPILNLSQNYELTRGNYYENQNNISFQEYNSYSFEKWFNYTLNIINEQLYFVQNKLKENEKTLQLLK